MLIMLINSIIEGGNMVGVRSDEHVQMVAVCFMSVD